MSYEAEVLADSPLGYWKLDEVSGTSAVDSSGNSNHGTYGGSLDISADRVACPVGLGATSIRFNGGGSPSSMVELPNGLVLPGNSPVTIEFWQTDVVLSASAAFTIGNDVNHRCQSHAPWFDEALYWDYWETAVGRISTNYGVPRTKQWTHVVLVAEDGFYAIYLDGVQATSQAISDLPATARIGGYLGGCPAQAVGHEANMAHFAVYDSVLSPARIKDHYVSGAKDAKAFVFDSFTDANGTELTDHTGELGASWAYQATGTGANTITDDMVSNVDGGYLITASGIPATTEYDVQGLFTNLTTFGTGFHLCLLARFTVSPLSFYAVRFRDNEVLEMFKYTAAGGFTTLGTDFAAFASWPTGGSRLLKFSIRDGSQEVYVDGVLKMATTDTELTNAGLVGLRGGDATTTRLVYFEALDLVLVAPKTNQFFELFE